MNFWITFWTILFFAAVAVFAGMSVWVTIGGWKDIRDLFRDLDREHKQDEEGGS